MRVLHLDSGRQMGGGQWQVLRLIEGLAAAGVHSTLVARGELLETARRRGWASGTFGLGRALILSRGHDVIHAHDAHGHTVGMLAGRPLVVSRRVAYPVRTGWKYARADRFVAVSAFVASILDRAGIPKEKIDVVYDGVPLLEAEPGEGTLVYGRKLAAVAMEAARLAGVEARATTDIEKEVRRGSLFVYLTESEGLGSGALLAMSAGAAVIASRTGGLPEAITSGENGLLVENRAEAVADAIRRVAGDPALRGRFGEAARQTVAERFSVARMVRRTMEVYQKVIG